MFSTLTKVEYKKDTKEVQLSVKVSDSCVQVFRIPLAEWRVLVAQAEGLIKEAGR